jgi:hypothetical protein
MNELLKELLKRVSALFIILGIILVLLAANGGIPLPGAKSFTATWVTILVVCGGILALAGIVMAVIDWRASIGKPADLKSTNTSSLNGKLDRNSIQQLENSNLTRAFRIPVDNSLRLERVSYLIEQEVNKGNGHLRLTASSGHSYLNPNGPVWKSAGIGSLIESNKIHHLEVVLESPFTSFSETRAIANHVTHNQWEEKQIVDHLVELLKYPNVDLRVTAESITCSLFFTSMAVFFDPYLWSLPDSLARTENNFWVLEFDKVTDPKFVNMDCYALLGRHFEFLQKNSIPLENLLYQPEQGGKVPHKEQYYKLFNKDPEAALNNYKILTADFHNRLHNRMKDK